jgi:bilirubin oxidase
VGQNTWELWLLKTGGGWFHPIHIHLISFFVVIRNKIEKNGVHSYEKLAAKDVVYLGMHCARSRS